MKDTPTVLITGCSSGFGMLSAVEFAKSGFHVLAAMRNPEKQTRLLELARLHGREGNITVFQLDVTEPEAIDRLKEMLDSIGRVDVLINNAGFAVGGFAEEVPLDDFRNQFETNFFGLVAVTRAVIPLMREAGKGRIVNISSISGLVGFPGLSPYVSSKFAVEGFSECLRLELKPFGIDVILIEPGSYATNIWTSGKKIAPRSQAAGSPYYTMKEQIENRILKNQQNFGDPLEVARLILHAATAPCPKFRYKIGRGVRAVTVLKRLLPWKWWESLLLRQLMD